MVNSSSTVCCVEGRLGILDLSWEHVKIFLAGGGKTFKKDRRVSSVHAPCTCNNASKDLICVLEYTCI